MSDDDLTFPTHTEYLAARVELTTPHRAFLERLAQLQEEYGLVIAPSHADDLWFVDSGGQHLGFEVPGYGPADLREFLAASAPTDAPALGGDGPTQIRPQP